MKLLILGRTASGKDTLRHELERRGVSFVKTATDRPMRENESDDAHEFLSTEDMDAVFDTLVATTVVNGHRYGFTREAYEAADAVIVDPKGMDDVVKAFPDEPVVLTYVLPMRESDRQLAAQARNADNELTQAREAAEHELGFDELESKIDSGQLGIESIWCTIYVRNDYQPHTIEAWADNIAAQLDAVRRLTDIVRQCRRLNILSGPEGDDNAVRLVHKTGDKVVRSAERTAVELLCDPLGLGTLMREWLATPDASVIPRRYAPAD